MHIIEYKENDLRYLCIKHLKNIGAIKKEIVLNYYIHKFNKIDSIKHFDLFSNIIKNLLKHGYEFNCSTYIYEDLNFYGYYSALFEYSGFHKSYIPVITEIEHGIRFGETKWPYFDYNTCYICQGLERIHEIGEMNPYMPVMAIGPFIHYASQYYNEKEIKELKNRYGKVLLVFPGHTCEWIDDAKKNDIVDYVYNNFQDDFDTIMVCAYWRDVESENIKKFREKGAVIVSAGFRQDKNFIRRLKTIITISDLVIANDIGTNIGFSLYLGKTFVLAGECQANCQDKTYTAYYKEFFDAFSLNGREKFSEWQKKYQLELYRRFWGDDLIKSSDEIKDLLRLIKKCLKISDYNLKKYHELIKREIQYNEVLDKSEQELLCRMVNV